MRTLKLLAAAVSLAAALPPAVAAGGRAYADAEIIGVVCAANKAELDAAALASAKSPSDAVKKFAERMRKDHGDAKRELADTAAQAGFTPSDTELSNGLTKAASDEAVRLGGLEGKDFDGAYIDAQVSDHASLLRSLDEDLIPSAKEPSIAALLRRLRTVVARHLEHARRLQADLERGRK
jgi:putative membrane protein